MSEQQLPGWVRHPKRGKSHRETDCCAAPHRHPAAYTRCGLVLWDTERIADDVPAVEDRCRLCLRSPKQSDDREVQE